MHSIFTVRMNLTNGESIEVTTNGVNKQHAEIRALHMFPEATILWVSEQREATITAIDDLSNETKRVQYKPIVGRHSEEQPSPTETIDNLVLPELDITGEVDALQNVIYVDFKNKRRVA